MTDCYPISTPSEPSLQLPKGDTFGEPSLQEKSRLERIAYRQAVGVE